MMLLFEFPDRYTPSAEAIGNIDGAIWLTPEEVGSEGEPVPSGAVLHVRGWALNLDGSGPAPAVVVSIDGSHKYHARVGGLRADVARHFENESLSTSGFEAILTTGRLTPGVHEIVAYIVDPQQRRYARIGHTLSFTIEADWTVLPPDTPRLEAACKGGLDQVVDESRGVTLTPNAGVVAVPRGSLLKLSGWIYDPSSTEPITKAYAVVDNERAFPVDYGETRLGVEAQAGSAVPANVGFRVGIPTVTLKRGTHGIDIFALAADGVSLMATPINLQVIVGQSSSARLPLAEMTSAFLDDVVRIAHGPEREFGAPLRMRRGDRIFVRGWAFDEPAGNIAAGVVFVIDGKIEVPALYGLARPDVAEVHGNDAILRSGFSGEIETDNLDAGLHTAECRVLSRDGRGAYLTAQRFEFELNEE